MTSFVKMLPTTDLLLQLCCLRG
ncbi:unnamed protein product [Staurois parvus]|uniref:Uncharacterized protein n=1 Tax=Staurois parvus TaxID=386267 RepID=A0ABN9G2C9_9NEOB|nr:unnamed protein product [Staurois parvus]